ncbi:MAG: tetratricopeptide repeat protein [Pseudomonadota bacterium]|nr:tetratricopeptide repeat protein [Pseudomonadota bacterium]
MPKQKCVVCATVTGKRACKIKGLGLVCPRCCAQIRSEDCDGCHYYARATRYQAARATQQVRPTSFVARIDPQVDEMLDQALTMAERGNLPGGEETVTELMRRHPDLHSVQYAMGVIFAIKKDYDRSIQYFDKAVEIFPYFVEAWHNKAVSHQNKLEIPEMIRAFRKVTEFGDPADGHVQQAKNRLAELDKTVRTQGCASLDVFLQAIQAFDEAVINMENREFQTAIAGFERASALNPNAPQAYGNMGICYGFLNEKEKALAAFDKALEIDPCYEPAIKNRSVILLLKEGQSPSDARFESMSYYKDYKMKKRSLLDEFIGHG